MTPADTSIVLATAEDTIPTLEGLVRLLGEVGERLDRMAIDGPLNETQHGHFQFARTNLIGLRALFAVEASRMKVLAAAAPTSAMTVRAKES